LAEETRDADCKGEEEEDSANCESEDPLQLEDGILGEELADTGGESQNGKLKANCVVLERSKEESSITEDTPDEDISYDTRDQVLGVLVHGNSTDPIKGHEIPGQWSADRADVNETGRGAVTEVRQR